MWKENFIEYAFKKTKTEKIHENEVNTKIEKMMEKLKKAFDKNPAAKIFEESEALALSIMINKYFMQPSEILKKCCEIGLKKNEAYGADNILRFKEKGLIVRLSDKYARIKNLLENEKNKTKIDEFNETIKDTLEDIINYSIYGRMLADKIWN